MLYIKHVSVKINWLLDQAILLLTEKKKEKSNVTQSLKWNNSIDKILKNFTKGYKTY